jgi:hypothetical protein
MLAKSSPSDAGEIGHDACGATRTQARPAAAIDTGKRQAGSAMRLSHAAQSGRHHNADRGLDLYETPVAASEALLRVEQLPHGLWEPATGRNAITNVLRRAGHHVIASDIADYGSTSVNFYADFLTMPVMPSGCEAIVTNPPFQLIGKFARHALDLAPKVYLLARLAFLESKGRTDILECRGLARVLVFKERLEMMHRAGWSGPRASSAMCFAWFCWNRDHTGLATLQRISRKRASAAPNIHPCGRFAQRPNKEQTDIAAARHPEEMAALAVKHPQQMDGEVLQNFSEWQASSSAEIQKQRIE